ncbi:MAG: alpha/beta hydrolase [Frankiales bacterium]|nr:alpha/beta hydrolase [Frankiales bacterium]
MDATPLTVSANDLSFGALSWGSPGDPLALLVHGYPDTAWTWRHLGPRLAARGWHAVAPFTRGYGPTDLAASYRAADLAQDVLALHAALGGDDRAVLVGHDWGAVTAYAVTAVAPDRFRHVVTLAVPPVQALLPPLPPLLLARQLRLSWYFAFNQLPGAERTLGTVVPRLWRDWSPGYDGTDDVARVLASLDTLPRRRAALQYYRDNLGRGVAEGFRTTPGAPFLYLHGDRDGCMQADLGERHADRFPPGSRFVRVPDVGHFLHLEDPERVGALVEEWVER